MRHVRTMLRVNYGRPSQPTQLHALVWDRPMTKLAAEFSLSDVALHKICRKHDVPTPPPGYWAKKTHGKPVKATPLQGPATRPRPLSTRAPPRTNPLAVFGQFVPTGNRETGRWGAKFPAYSLQCRELSQTVLQLTGAENSRNCWACSRLRSALRSTVQTGKWRRTARLSHLGVEQSLQRDERSEA